MPTPAPKLLDHVRQTLRTQHYAYRTEKAYLYWIKRFILFHHKQHPKTMNSAEIEAFLTHLDSVYPTYRSGFVLFLGPKLA